MIVRTLNSTYEIDETAKRARCTAGNGTPRTSEWRRYVEISDVCVGQILCIVWGDETPHAEGTTPATLTSPVMEVEP